MQLDIRIPIGLLFGIIGAMLVILGLATWGNAEMYDKSLGLNVNFWWGVVMLVFAGMMLWLARLAAADAARSSTDERRGR